MRTFSRRPSHCERQRVNHEDRVGRWLDDLASTLARAEELAERGPEAFHSDPALPLAFEALSNRIGDLAKRLIATDPDRFSGATWRAAARHRDFVVHHYDRVDIELLWRTVTRSFPELAALVALERGPGPSAPTRPRLRPDPAPGIVAPPTIPPSPRDP